MSENRQGQHRQVRAALEAALFDGGDLTASSDLSQHLADCDECSAWVEDYRLFGEVVADTGGEHPSSELLARMSVDPESLGSEEGRALRRHLEICGDCRADVELTAGALSAARDPRAAEPKLAPASPPALRWAVAAAALVAVALAFSWDRGGVAEPDLTLATGSLEGSRLVETDGILTAMATTIEDGAEIEFRAGESVVLGDGFSVGNGASLEVVLGRPGDQQDSEST